MVILTIILGKKVKTDIDRFLDVAKKSNKIINSLSTFEEYKVGKSQLLDTSLSKFEIEDM